MPRLSWFGWIIVSPFILVGGLILFVIIYNVILRVVTYDATRFRLTVEITTPNGVRSGSSVIEIGHWDESFIPGWGTRSQSDYWGEAVFVDLGDGRNIVALFVGGPHGRQPGWILGTLYESFSTNPTLKPSVGKEAIVPIPSLTTLATFANIHDFRSGKVVGPDEIEDFFGVGFRYSRATIEIVPRGFRILEIFGISAGGVPLYRGIEKLLPFIVTQREEMPYLSA